MIRKSTQELPNWGHNPAAGWEFAFVTVPGSGETISSTRQLEAGWVFFYNWHCSWQLLGNDDSHFLLGCIQNRLLSVGISCVNHWENNSWWPLKACVCNIPASEHYQSGSHICDPILKLVLCWESWLVACEGLLGCSAGCYFDCSPC